MSAAATDEDRVTAYHEAGHTFIAYLVGVERDVSIIPDAESAGRTRHDRPSRTSWHDAETGVLLRGRPIDHRLRILAAGAEAAALFLREPYWIEGEPQSQTRSEIEAGARFDRQEERKLVNVLTVEDFGEAFFRDAVGHLRVRPDAWKHLGVWRKQTLHTNRWKARQMLALDRATLDDLADKLFKAGFLSRDILSQFFGSHEIQNPTIRDEAEDGLTGRTLARP